MIRNTQELLRKIPEPYKKKRRVLLEIADFVLREVQPEKLLKGKFSKASLRSFEKVVVIGIGKAAKGMVKATLAQLPRKADAVLLADTGHPIPTLEGMKKTARIIKEARSLGEKDLAIVLLSGGGSAMLVAPAPGVTLNDKMAVTKALLKSGATIQEMNVVRKHLSAIKGGWLAALLSPATVWGFVISDVPGNDLSTIASGPLSPDPSTIGTAQKILKKYAIKLPKNVQMLETPKAHERYFEKVTLNIIADHSLTAALAAKRAKTLRLAPRIIKKTITGEARQAARAFLKQARGKGILIGSGETTVTCRGNGSGGRNQEFVLASLPYLKPGQALLSIGTDGVDGICPIPIAGAIGDTSKHLNLNISHYLERNDSYHFFKKSKGLIKTGATGTNVGDLMLLIQE